MKVFPFTVKGIQIDFSIEAESEADQNLINLMTRNGDHWKDGRSNQVS